MIKSKANKKKTGLSGFVWAHGGAGIYGDAITDNGGLSNLATLNDVVCFNVNYRLAPEHKSPAGAKDCIATLKYVIENCKKYGVNPEQVAMGGSSGGGYVTMVASILLARDKKASLVKTLILVAPMLGRNLEDEPEHLVPSWEKSYVNSLPYNLLVDDFETMNAKRDPILYPFHISDKEAKLLPKTVLFTSEFDWMRKDTHRLIPKLKRAGVYLDHADYAGSAHYSNMVNIMTQFSNFIKRICSWFSRNMLKASTNDCHAIIYCNDIL